MSSFNSDAVNAWLDGIKSTLRGYTEALSAPLDWISNPWLGGCLIGGVFLILMIYNVMRRNQPGMRSLKHTKTLAVCSLLIALNVILGYFSIYLSPYMRIGFGFITSPAAGMLFGPVASGIVAVLADVIKYILKPAGPYLPVYTISVGISGMLYGMVLFRRKPTFLRILAAVAAVSVIGNIILGSIALAPTMAKGLVAILPGRIIKDLLLIPVHTVVLYFVLKIVKKIA